MTPEERDARLAAIYARIPKMKCKGLCQACCGPIGMSQAEMDRIQEQVGSRVQPTDLGQSGVGLNHPTCPLLVNGRCSVYEVRPVICRVWGVVKSMRCPHGCRPNRWLSDAESHQLVRDARAIDFLP